MRASGYALAPEEPSQEPAAATEGRGAGRAPLPQAERAGLAALAAAGLSAGSPSPQEPTGGQPGTAPDATPCYWCGGRIRPGAPVWRYPATVGRERRAAVAHPACHADATGEP